MQTLAFQQVESARSVQPPSPIVLGTSSVLDFEEFPELSWISAYLTHLHLLQDECDRLTRAIKAIADDGDVYRGYWIEPYSKTKNGKTYTYAQLRWLTGERKPSGQPKVKTKHLSYRVLAEVQAAVARGRQIEALGRERRQVEAEMKRLKGWVQGIGQRLQSRLPQNVGVEEGRAMASKTLETYSIPIPPHLAGLLKQTLGRSGTGFDEAAFLQQLHY